jgi:hypothetical protein
MGSLRRFVAATAVLLLVFAAAWGEDGDPITVERMPATISSHTYDPENPPAQMPATQPDEAGVTVSDFSCVAKVGGQITEQSQDDGEVLAKVKVDAVHITLRLNVGEWVSKTAPPRKIWAHEDGHRMIALHFYMNAKNVAMGIGHQMMGRSIVGSGQDVDSAARSALHEAAQEIDAQYMIEVRDLSERVQEAYDRITEHGTNSIDEADAINAALQETAPSQKNAASNEPVD